MIHLYHQNLCYVVFFLYVTFHFYNLDTNKLSLIPSTVKRTNLSGGHAGVRQKLLQKLYLKWYPDRIIHVSFTILGINIYSIQNDLCGIFLVSTAIPVRPRITTIRYKNFFFLCT